MIKLLSKSISTPFGSKIINGPSIEEIINSLTDFSLSKFSANFEIESKDEGSYIIAAHITSLLKTKKNKNWDKYNWMVTFEYKNQENEKITCCGAAYYNSSTRKGGFTFN